MLRERMPTDVFGAVVDFRLGEPFITFGDTGLPMDVWQANRRELWVKGSDGRLHTMPMGNVVVGLATLGRWLRHDHGVTVTTMLTES